MGAPEQAATGYAPRRPEKTTLYAVVQHDLETWLAQLLTAAVQGKAATGPSARREPGLPGPVRPAG